MESIIISRTFRFKKIEYARNFDKLLKSTNFKYTFRRFKRNDRYGTIIFEFVVVIDDNSKYLLAG